MDIKKLIEKATINNNFNIDNLNNEERELVIKYMKKKSRSKYLDQRQHDQIEIKNEIIKRQKEIFENIDLDKREIETLEKEEKLLNYAKIIQNKDKKDEKYYNLPDHNSDDGIDTKKKRLLENNYDLNEFNEKNDWENYQINRVKKSKNIFFEQIDFNENDKKILKGNNNENEIDKYEEYINLKEEKKNLPVFKKREDILELIKNNKVVILVGDTGSGKTTQIPQYLYESGYCESGKIGITQPRRVAAISVANRVSKEMNQKWGDLVGYTIRFEDCTSEKTCIKYLTEGILMREFINESDLKTYSVIIIDEAHERTISTDILLCLLKDLVNYRDDFKLIISSATLDANKFSKYFFDAPIINIPGRRFNVDIYYTKTPESDYIESSIITALQIHVTQDRGDILVFLTGQEEIDRAKNMIFNRIKGMKKLVGELIVLPLYSNLSSEEQIKIFEKTPEGSRKIILSTNIAETSITIDNIIYVIDCGLSKQTCYNPKNGIESLMITPISKASADQRAGRVGRIKPGKCFRIYTLWTFENELEENTIPEIKRSNLNNSVLYLKTIGIKNLLNFDFIDKPPHELLARSLNQLYALDVLNDEGELTQSGKLMSEFPLNPMLSKTIIESNNEKCLHEVLIITSMLTISNNWFLRPKDNFIHADNQRLSLRKIGGDHFSFLNIYNLWKQTNYSKVFCKDNYLNYKSLIKSKNIYQQLKDICEKINFNLVEEEFNKEKILNIKKSFLSGYFLNSAKFTKLNSYKTLKNSNVVYIHPSSYLYKFNSDFIIYYELIYTNKEYMRGIMEVDANLLKNANKNYFKNSDLIN